MDKFVCYFQKKTFNKGDNVVNAGDKLNYLYIICSGQFEVLYPKHHYCNNLISLSYLSEYIANTKERFTENQKFELRDKNIATTICKVNNLIILAHIFRNWKIFRRYRNYFEEKDQFFYNQLLTKQFMRNYD